MISMTVRELGTTIAEAFHLVPRPLAVYGSTVLPEGGIPVASVNRCLAATMYHLATTREQSPVYVGVDAKAGCCPGGLTYLGFIEYPSAIKYFVSTGKKEYRGGEAEFLKSDPEIVERCFKAAGKISPPGKYVVIQACEAVPDTSTDILSLCLFGNAEQVRNLAALVHFDRDEPFYPVLVPWGPVCSTLITYPAGMASKAPSRTAFMGPSDPTTNYALPPDTMAMGLPVSVAKTMVQNIGNSFIKKRPDVAFPEKRSV